MRQSPSVDQAFFAGAGPVVAQGRGEQRLQLAGQARDVDAPIGDAGVQPLAQLVEQCRTDLPLRPNFGVVGARENTVAGRRRFEHAAAAGDDGGRAVGLDFLVGIGQQAESQASTRLAFAGRAGVIVPACLGQQTRDLRGDNQRMHRVPGLIFARAPQRGQAVADERPDARARGLHQVFGFFEHRLLRDAGVADLGDREHQQAARSFGQARMVEGAQPGVEALPKIALHAGPFIAGQRLDAELFEHVEQRAFDAAGRGQTPVQCVIRGRQPQSQTIGGAAKRREIVALDIGVQVGGVQRQPHPAPMQTSAAEMQVALSREGLDRGDAKRLDVQLAACLRLNLGHEGVGSSASKQRW